MVHNGFNEAFSNKKLSKLFQLIAAVYLLNNENRFKVIAYQKAAETTENLAKELYNIWEEGKLREVPGFKASIGESVDELFRTGESKHFDRILAGVPKTLPVLMEVPGIGPKKAIKLINEFKLYDEKTVFDDIVKIANEGKIATLPTFGEKSQADIKAAIELFQSVYTQKTRMPLPIATEIARTVSEHMKKLKEVIQIDYMGSLRRQLSTIGDVDISIRAAKEDARKIVDHFLAIPGKLAIDNAGDEKASIVFPPNVRVDLRVTDDDHYGAMLQYFTGSKQHNINLREFALRKGYSLNEYGIKDVKTGELHLMSDEKKFYGFLGLDLVPPEIREGTSEITLALKHELPKLITKEDIKGDFHIHSSYDIKTSHDVGTNTYQEIVDKAVDIGYKYIGFADHNPRQSGITEAEIIEIMKVRKEHIDNVLKDSKIPYYISLEIDILPNGDLALPEKAFEYIDFAIVSIHSSFNQGRDEQTERILKALSHPKVKVWGHPTGRLINKRDGVHLNWPKVFDFVAEKNIAVEINCGPLRLDLPDSLVREGMEKGVLFMINTDSHDIVHMDFMEYGISVARRGWLEPKHVMNTYSEKDFHAWITS
jgi:DNA polymerase (family 10)